jgi:pyruvate ferredoxin oxidoreductase gamma subunit
MFQVRIHGRGGQGVVTAAELLSVAAFREGKHAQAFPSFGSERTGAPVVSFCRIDDKEIRLREPILEPDALIVQDPTLLKAIDVFNGLRPDGYLLINTNRDLAELGIGAVLAKLPAGHARAVPATEFAVRHVGRPVPNAALARRLRGARRPRAPAFGRRCHSRSVPRKNRRGERRCGDRRLRGARVDKSRGLRGTRCSSRPRDRGRRRRR